jgi:Leucine-rich repeat (LRR) protein
LGKNLIETLPGNITSAGNEEVLDLHGNWISTIPTELFLLTNLVILNLENNQVEALPSEVSQMANLFPCQTRGLLLSQNRISRLPSELGLLTSLLAWNFESNAITSMPDVDWEQLSVLRKVNLRGSLLNSTIPTELGLAEDLRELHLSSSLMHGTIPSQLSHVGMLNISVNSLTGTLPSELRRLSGLLDVSNNQLVGPIPSEIGSVEGNVSFGYWYDTPLVLRLNNNLFNGSLPTELGGLSDSSVLDLSNNMISGLIPSEFGLLKSAIDINLQGNNFTGRLPEELCPWYCIRQWCSTVSDTIACEPGPLLVDCSPKSSLDCSTCVCNCSTGSNENGSRDNSSNVVEVEMTLKIGLNPEDVREPTDEDNEDLMQGSSAFWWDFLSSQYSSLDAFHATLLENRFAGGKNHAIHVDCTATATFKNGTIPPSSSELFATMKEADMTTLGSYVFRVAFNDPEYGLYTYIQRLSIHVRNYCA